MTERILINRILGLSRGAKQALMLVADTLGLMACVWCAAWLLFADELSAADIMPLAAATLVVTVLLARYQGFYHSIVRYVGMDLAVAGLKVVIPSAATLAAVAYYFQLSAAPVRLAIAFGALYFLYLLGSRFTAQYCLNRRNSSRERVIVYGAGESGARLVLAMQDGNSFLPVALVDDKESMRNKRVGGCRVYPSDDLSRLIEQLGVTRVLLALPTASRRRRHSIITKLERLAIHVQTIPDFNDLVTGKARVDDIRDVDVEDLLQRDAVPPDQKLLTASVTRKSVMVTGAGGSIGSELCRQILKLRPKMIVLFEISEVALYNIEKELQKLSRKLGIECDVVALLGSIHHKDRVLEIMQTFEVNTVYHAAAYKHVPVVEQNVLEGVHNNIFGTLHTAMAAVEAKVDTFVLVSTDKAVSPTNVMGATKRFSELLLQAMQDQYPSIRFSMVRFGNVLESSGSVVPLFREQIRAGGPVTVTHRDIIREAAQLVIQAGAMARGGDVFVLDMGKPVRIQDLARHMINLMGLTVRDDDNPDGDIEIQYTGLRPAEKLYEELLIGSNVSGTHHPRIMRANEEYIDYEQLLPLIEELRSSSLKLDRDRVRDVLLHSVSGYSPTNGIDDLVWIGAKRMRAKDTSDNVVDLTPRSA
ncbi:MAG: polysaccharide biosynthesis protein [Planctomycetota bacterium]|jgi:FlaA1/EpsC-like NDP-sugar epimerase